MISLKSSISVLIVLLLVVSACKKHQTKVAEDLHKYSTPDIKETDPMMVKYKGKLQEVFGRTSIDLIRRYRETHRDAKTDSDFYHLFKVTKTLLSELDKDLKNYNKKLKKGGAGLPDLSWFKEVGMGMEIDLLPGDHYKLFLDQKELINHASQTEGLADDHYLELLKMVYAPHSQFPRWLRLDDIKYAACSSLGDGMHAEVLDKMDEALLESKIFESDIEQLHVQLMHDVLRQSVYCNPKAKVIKEMRSILTDAHIKREEKQMLRERLELIEGAGVSKLQFNCNAGDCQYPN